MGATLDDWPNCAIADCPNKCCLRLSSYLCWPHIVGLPIDWAEGLTEAQREVIRRCAEGER